MVYQWTDMETSWGEVILKIQAYSGYDTYVSGAVRGGIGWGEEEVKIGK